MPAHIGTFGVCPTSQPDPQQTPKEPILPTRNNDVDNIFTRKVHNKTFLFIFDTIVKKYNSRCKQKI